MRTAYLIAQPLKALQTPNNNDRLARAMHFVNAFAFAVPMTAGQSFEDFSGAAQPQFKKLLNEVNENVAMDTKLAQALFDKALRVRYALATGTPDPVLVQMAMVSLTAEDYNNADQAAMAEWLTSRGEFIQAQTAIGSALSEFFTQPE